MLQSAQMPAGICSGIRLLFPAKLELATIVTTTSNTQIAHTIDTDIDTVNNH